MSDKKIEIYIAVHKKANVLKREGYIPLHVGAEGKEDLGFVKDNTGDNISCKNPNYCELTGLYWIWKNCNADIVGLVHYRRYFVKSFFTTNIEKAITKKCKKLLKGQKGLEELKLFDIYRDEKIGKNKKSVAYSLIFRDKTKSLSDDEINPVMEEITKELEEKFGAELRK